MEHAAAVPETIGALLARVRMAHGISQLRLAERLCGCAGVATVTRHEVSRWEREERIPSAYWLSWLAEALQVPVEDLERAAASARRRRAFKISPYEIPPNWTEYAAGVYVRAS